MFQAETFEAVCNEWIRLDQGMHPHSGNFHGICNTERMDVDREDGLTDEEREQLPPGL